MPDLTTVAAWAAALGAFGAGVYQGAKRVLGRKYPSVDEVVAQMERDQRAQRERLERDTGPIPGEKTPAERPSVKP